MIDFKNLTNEQVAILTFALESYADGAREDGVMESVVAEANRLAIGATREYEQRKLHWKMFYDNE